MAIRQKDKTREKVQGKAKERIRDKDQSRTVEASPSRFAGIQRFVRETRSELKKVVWPTRETAVNLTVVVVVVSGVVAIFLGGVDFVFKWFFQTLFGG